MAHNLELIGSTIEVVESKNQTLIGLKGKVLDETKSTITIKGKKIRKILKSHVVIKINNKKIKGKSLVGHPKDRIK